MNRVLTKSILRLALFTVVLAVACLGAPSSQAGNGKLWCQDFLQGEPREIRVLHEYLDSEWKASPAKNYLSRGDDLDYAPLLVGILYRTFSSKFHDVSPSVRARFIAYTLVKWLPIPVGFDAHLALISDWILGEIETRTDYSADDLETIRLAYRVFTLRRPNLIRKLLPRGTSDPRRLKNGMSVVTIDTMTTLLAAHELPMLMGAAHPLFVPLPLMSITIGTIKLAIRASLSPASVKKVNEVKAKFLTVMAPKLSPEGLAESWNETLSHLTEKDGSLSEPGVLVTFVDEYTKLLSSQPFEKDKFSEILFSWARDLSQVNALHWEEILATFEILRGTLRQLGYSAAEAKPLYEILEKASKNWVFDSSIKEKAQAFLETPYERQALSPQEEP